MGAVGTQAATLLSATRWRRSGRRLARHRFGSSLNTYVHFHCVVVDGVFEALQPGAAAASSDQPSGIRFRPACNHDEAATALAQADCRRRRQACVRAARLMDALDAKEMNSRAHHARPRSLAAVDTVSPIAEGRQVARGGLKDGTGAVEERARYELGMIKQNEIFVQILGDKPKVTTPAAPPATK